MTELWPRISVGSLVEAREASLQTGPFGTQLSASEYVSEGIPVINVRNVGFGDVRADDLEFVSEGKADQLHHHVLRTGDIVFGRKGAVERHALIGNDQDGWIQGSDCLRLRLRSSRFNVRFVSFYLRTKGHQDWMQALCSFGATMSSLNQDIVNRIQLPCPPRPVQDRIAAVLTAYDDLIANNQRRIALLESMAEEIYREWFVRMRFPGCETATFSRGIPEGWEVVQLGEHCDVVKGKSYASEDLVDDPTAMPFVTLKSFNRGGGYRAGGLKHYKGEFKSEQLVKQGDIVMAVTDMTQDRVVVGRAARVPDLGERGAVISLDVIKLAPKKIDPTYLYLFLRFSGFANHIKEFANGANVLHLKPDLVPAQKVVMPPRTLQDQLSLIAVPMLQQAEQLAQACQRLSEMRDALLPRLIAGKLRVEALDIQFPPSMQPPPAEAAPHEAITR